MLDLSVEEFANGVLYSKEKYDEEIQQIL